MRIESFQELRIDGPAQSAADRATAMDSQPQTLVVVVVRQVLQELGQLNAVVAQELLPFPALVGQVGQYLDFGHGHGSWIGKWNDTKSPPALGAFRFNRAGRAPGSAGQPGPARSPP